MTSLSATILLVAYSIIKLIIISALSAHITKTRLTISEGININRLMEHYKSNNNKIPIPVRLFMSKIPEAVLLINLTAWIIIN